MEVLALVDWTALATTFGSIAAIAAVAWKPVSMWVEDRRAQSEARNKARNEEIQEVRNRAEDLEKRQVAWRNEMHDRMTNMNDEINRLHQENYLLAKDRLDLLTKIGEMEHTIRNQAQIISNISQIQGQVRATVEVVQTNVEQLKNG